MILAQIKGGSYEPPFISIFPNLKKTDSRKKVIY